MVKLLGLELFLKDRPPRTVQFSRRFHALMDRGDAAHQVISLPGVKACISATPDASDGLSWRINMKGQLHHPLHAILEIESIWPERIFCNGYNDWTGSRERRVHDIPGRLRMPLRPLLSPYTDIPFTEPWLRTDPAHHRSHSVTYLRKNVRDSHDTIVFFGSLNERHAWTWFEFSGNRLFVHVDLEGVSLGDDVPTFDLWTATGNSADALFALWFERQALPDVQAHTYAGYTTWYYHYNDIAPSDVEGVLAGFKGLASAVPPEGSGIEKARRTGKGSKKATVPAGIGLDVVQIDDGFQRHVGDWLDLKPAFGRSMRPLVDRIHREGARAGLWLAPFIAERDSRLFREHPDWIARDHRGVAVRAGFNPLWSYWFYALDLSNEEVREYLQMVFSVVIHEWGFDFLKLDFLYAAALQPPERRSRAEHLHDAIDLIHEIAGWSASPAMRKPFAPLLLGCGIPLSVASGRFDYCRVGSDVKESWEDPFLRFMNYQERVSTFNSLISTISRRHWNHRAFLNDPDVYYLRQNYRALSVREKRRPIPLSEDERKTLFLLNHIFGSLLFTSDPVQEYDEAARHMRSLAFPLATPQNVTVEEEDLLYTIRFQVEGEWCVALANLRDRAARIPLPAFPENNMSQPIWHEGPLTASTVEAMDALVAPGHVVVLSAHASCCFTMVDSSVRNPRSKTSRRHLFRTAH